MSGTSTNLLIPLNATFSEGYNVTNVTAEPPKEGADCSKAGGSGVGAPATFVGAPTRPGQFCARPQWSIRRPFFEPDEVQ